MDSNFNITTIVKGKQIYEGKAKTLFSTNNPNLIIQYFKDDATAFNGVKKETIQNKGELNNFISEAIMKQMEIAKIDNHFIARISNREQIVKKLNIIPLEVIVRNVVAGSLVKKFALTEGVEITKPIVEICFKDDSLGDPMINEDHAINLLGLVNKEQMLEIREKAFAINNVLRSFFLKASLILVDFKVEFGFDDLQNIILADEISPDSCRLWDLKTKTKLDKDVFRYNLGDISKSYQEIADRIGVKICK